MPNCRSFLSPINQKLFYFCKKNAHVVNPDSYREVDMRKLKNAHVVKLVDMPS